MDRALPRLRGRKDIPEPSSGTDTLEGRGPAVVTVTGHCHQRGTGRARSEDAGAAGEAAAVPVSMATSALGPRWR